MRKRIENGLLRTIAAAGNPLGAVVSLLLRRELPQRAVPVGHSLRTIKHMVRAHSDYGHVYQTDDRDPAHSLDDVMRNAQRGLED